MTDLGFDGKVAIITGAGGGLGKQHALLLASRGARVVVNDVGGSVAGEGSDRGPAEAAAEEIRRLGGEAVSDNHSVSTPEGGEAIVQTAIDAFGQVDIVVNNAGILRDKAFQNMAPELLDPVLDVHLKGAFYVTRPAWGRMREQGYGRVVNTSSNAGILGNFGQTNYGPAKAAIVGLTQTLSLELGGIGVTVNAISPGGITRLSGTISGADSVPEPDERTEDEFNPKDPSLASPVVAWLASEQAGYVTGQVIRAIGEDISLMQGWTRKVTVSSGGKRWDATKLGQVMATDIFGTRAPGLRLGS